MTPAVKNAMRSLRLRSRSKSKMEWEYSDGTQEKGPEGFFFLAEDYAVRYFSRKIRRIQRKMG